MATSAYRTKYDISLSSEVMIEYHDRLINRIYKALTIFEGKDYSTKEVVMPKNEALNEFRKYTNNLLYEVSGCKHLFIENKEFVTLLALLVELHTKEEHKDVRNLVFSSINIVKEMKELLKDGI